MSNPYETPEADLQVAPKGGDYPTLGWKILFFLLLPFELWYHVDAFVVNDYGYSLVWRLVSLVVYGLYMIALFGLAFKKVIAGSAFWRFYLPVLIGVDLIDLVEIIPDLLSEDTIILIVSLAVLLPILFLLWYSVYRYSIVLREYLT